MCVNLRVPSELHVELSGLVARSTVLLHEADVGEDRLCWVLTFLCTLHESVSLLVLHSPRENLSHSAFNVASSLFDLTNRSRQFLSVDDSLSELLGNISIHIELVVLLEVFLRERNLLVSIDRLLNLIPTQLLIKNVLVTTVQSVVRLSECWNLIALGYGLSRLFLAGNNLQFHVTNISNLTTHQQLNTYQRHTANSSLILGVAPLLLLTVLSHLSTESVSILIDLCVSTLRGLVLTIEITNKLELVCETRFCKITFCVLSALVPSVISLTILCTTVCVYELTEVDTILIVPNH